MKNLMNKTIIDLAFGTERYKTDIFVKTTDIKPQKAKGYHRVSLTLPLAIRECLIGDVAHSIYSKSLLQVIYAVC